MLCCAMAFDPQNCRSLYHKLMALSDQVRKVLQGPSKCIRVPTLLHVEWAEGQHAMPAKVDLAEKKRKIDTECDTLILGVDAMA